MTTDKQQANLTPEATQAMARSRELPEQAREMPRTRTVEEQAADDFAAKAIEAVLTPAPDGLEVLEELARRIKPPRR